MLPLAGWSVGLTEFDFNDTHRQKSRGLETVFSACCRASSTRPSPAAVPPEAGWRATCASDRAETCRLPDSAACLLSYFMSKNNPDDPIPLERDGTIRVGARAPSDVRPSPVNHHQPTTINLYLIYIPFGKPQPLFSPSLRLAGDDVRSRFSPSRRNRPPPRVRHMAEVLAEALV